MTYVPKNINVWTRCFGGTLSGMGAANRTPTSDDPDDYGPLTSVAGAFAESFDTVWDTVTSSAAPDSLQLVAIEEICEAAWHNRVPTPAGIPFDAADTYNPLSEALVAMILAGSAYAAGQGITPNAGGSGCVVQKGFDAVVGDSVVLVTEASLPDALDAPSLDRSGDTPGTPIEITFPVWTPGDVLSVSWAASAFPDGLTSLAALAFAIPVVIVDGGARQFIDNGGQAPTQLGVAPALIAFQANGISAVQIDTEGPVVVQLGVALFSPVGTDFITFFGNPLNVADNSPQSTWLAAERLQEACVVNVPAEVTLTDLPIPDSA